MRFSKALIFSAHQKQRVSGAGAGLVSSSPGLGMRTAASCVSVSHNAQIGMPIVLLPLPASAGHFHRLKIQVTGHHDRDTGALVDMDCGLNPNGVLQGQFPGAGEARAAEAALPYVGVLFALVLHGFGPDIQPGI